MITAMHYLKTAAILACFFSLASASLATPDTYGSGGGSDGSNCVRVITSPDATQACVNFCIGKNWTPPCMNHEVKLDYSCYVLPNDFQLNLWSVYVPKGTACAFHQDLQCKDINTSPNGGSSISYPGSGDLSKFGLGWGGKVKAVACWPFNG